MEGGDGHPCRSKKTRVIVVLETSEAPESVISRASSQKNMLGLTTQLESNLTTAMKENKNCFSEYISNKKRAKENFHTLLDVVGNSDKEWGKG